MNNLGLIVLMKKMLLKLLNFYSGTFFLIFFLRYVLGRVFEMNFDFLGPAFMIPFLNKNVVEPAGEFGFAAREMYFEHIETIDTMINVALRLVILSILVLTGQLLTPNFLTVFMRFVVKFLDVVGAINLIRLQVSVIVVRVMGLEKIGYVLWFLLIGSYLAVLEYVKFIIRQQDAIQKMLDIKY